ncbi:MAG: ATP-binding protein [Nitrolancea sp.]
MDWIWNNWDITIRTNGLWLALVIVIAILVIAGAPVVVNTIWSWRAFHARRSTAEFSRLIDSLPIGVMLVNPDGVIVRANHRAEELWPGVGVGKIVPPDLMRLQGPSDGSASALLSSPAGAKVIGRVHDLPVRRGRETLISLEDASHLQDESDLTTSLLRQVTHELKTPLSVIRGHASRFAESGPSDPAEARRAWAVVDDEATRLTALVDQALLMSRLETPDPLFERRPVNLRALCEEAVIDLSERAAMQDAELEFEVDEGRFIVSGDRPALRQVLLNLLDNALKYGGSGVRVTLGLRRNVQGEIRLSVSDSGPGISDTDLPFVFEKGFRGGRVRGSRVGSGLGLALVRSIVAWHGGTVSVENSPGTGASVVVLLPNGAEAS